MYSKTVKNGELVSSVFIWVKGATRKGFNGASTGGILHCTVPHQAAHGLQPGMLSGAALAAFACSDARAELKSRGTGCPSPPSRK